MLLFSHLVLFGWRCCSPLPFLVTLRSPLGGVAFPPLLLEWYWFPSPSPMFVSIVNRHHGRAPHTWEGEEKHHRTNGGGEEAASRSRGEEGTTQKGEWERTTGKSCTTRKGRGRKAPPPHKKRRKKTAPLRRRRESSTGHKEQEGGRGPHKPTRGGTQLFGVVLSGPFIYKRCCFSPLWWCCLLLPPSFKVRQGKYSKSWFALLLLGGAASRHLAPSRFKI